MDQKEELTLYLKKYSALNRRIDEKMSRINSLFEKASRITPSYEVRTRGGSIHKAGDLIVKKADLQRDLLEDLNLMVDLRREFGRLFDQIEDDRQRLLLEYRYFDDMTFEKIAEHLDLTLRYTFRLHRAPLDSLLLTWISHKGVVKFTTPGRIDMM